MVVIVDRTAIRGNILGEIATLENLLAELRAIAEGRLPDPKRIAEAPLIENWQLFTAGSTVFVETKSGEPPWPPEAPSAKVQLWAWAPNMGWAITTKRLLRLGKMGGPTT